MGDEQTQLGTSGAAAGAVVTSPARPKVADQVADQSETTEQKVRRWMHESLANGPLARNTELWNVVDGALGALVDIIDGK